MIHPTQHRLDLLEREIRNLRIESNRFLAGTSDSEPTELCDGIRIQIRALQEKVEGAAQRFRLSGLEARFLSIQDLFRRRGRELDERQRRQAEEGEPAAPEDCRTVFGDAVDRDRALPLYEALYGGRPDQDVDLESFLGFLEQQRARIQEQSGGPVVFRVARENGKRRLKARPARDADFVAGSVR